MTGPPNGRMAQGLDLFDIAIAGGGPAGAVAAILLARAGFRVGIATLPASRERIEGLSPRVAAILRAHRIALDGVAPPSQRRAIWGDLRGDQNVEHVVRRARFDNGLLAQARREGVRLFEGAIASVLPETGMIRLADGRELRAGLLFEARGRRAPRLPRSGTRRGGWTGPDTISMAGFVTRPDGHDPGSVIEARPEGWTWQARLADGRDWMQVVGDASALANLRGAQARVSRLWQHVLGAGAPGSPGIAPPARPVVSAAASRLNAPVLDLRCPRLGDAAVALDPLSGHGLFWAISSALMALPLARAIFGGKTDLARAFYRDRVVETFWRQARIGRDFYATSGQTGGFWRARRLWPDTEPAHPALATPRLEPRVLLRNGELGRGEVLVTSADPGGAAFVMGQEIAPVLRAIRGRPLPAAAVFHQRYLPQSPADVAERVHGWLIDRGLGQGPTIRFRTFDEEKSTCENKQAV
ncbi:flavin-dependent monooxygenase QhpG [Pukyongiella litopenaei]|uniref:Dehydrogenase (Flavoprotein) n=1 Tax=Pukyongiella litopenaei TaxID=2605946 RepID=A0A2S0MKA1_9RHOB|nr:hypothetical protein [Pukyongiella litopenaei]AVO36318.2 hypothetical protein C6Y53_00395 [Pukyongiella litopenaei]